LVATAEKDRLAYIFPSKLDRDETVEVDHNLRMQRLNVGLSRGQEKLVFVHSKPTEQYSSALRVALQHYRNEVDRAMSMPTADDVDSASPMELKVVHWLSQVPIIRDLGADCEVIAQFELGKYLRQLDPSYRHPDYRVDFLIRMKLDGCQHQLVLEYDGFEFHFNRDIPASAINSSSWRSYLTADDLEREKVLEGFGVQMIRLNRFNIGKDPVGTIDSLLREKLEGLINGSGPHDLVAKMAARASEIAEGLKAGKFKRCKKCDRDLPVEMFADDAAKSGIGRHCRDCKSAGPKSHKAKFRRSYRG
jgi:very-short-patch-repair endonuclease